MSSILKALKKLDDERSRREGAAGDIGRDILRSQRRRRSPTGLWALLVGLVLGGGVVFAIVVWRPESYRPGAVELSVAPHPASRQEPAVEKKEGTPASTEDRAGRDIPERVASDQPNTRLGPDDNPPQAAGASKLPPSPPLSLATGEQPTRVAGRPAEPAGAESPPVATANAPDDLVLSGIAWQKDRDGRMAVINDLPVMEGTIIEQAQVVEILPDRVRLEREGTIIDLQLQP